MDVHATPPTGFRVRTFCYALFRGFYEAACQVPTVLESANVVPGTPPATRARSSHGAGVSANGEPSVTSSSSHPRCMCDNEVTHPFIRACLGTTTYGAGEDPTEERRPLYHGSHMRP